MNSEKDSLDGAFHNASIKKILVLIRNVGFEGFLKQQFVDFGMSPCEVFKDVVCDVVTAIAYANKKEDKGLLEFISLLTAELESEQSDYSPLAKSFAKFIKTVTGLGKNKICANEIISLLGFGVFFVISEKIPNDKNPSKLMIDNYKYN